MEIRWQIAPACGPLTPAAQDQSKPAPLLLRWKPRSLHPVRLGDVEA